MSEHGPDPDKRTTLSKQRVFSAIALIFSVLLPAALILITFLMPRTAVSAEPSRQGWYFDRVNGIGDEIVYACPAGVEISYPGHDMKLVSVPPSWNTIWYAPQTHCKFEQTLADFQRTRAFGKTPVKLPREQVTHAGIKAIKIAARHSPGEVRFGSLLMPDYGAKKLKADVLESDLYVSESLGLPKGAIAMLSAYYHTADYGGVPLAEIRKLSDGTTNKIWFTRYVKPIVVPQAELECPKGFRQMKSWQELTATEYGSKFDDLARDMKLGEEFGSKKQSK